MKALLLVPAFEPLAIKIDDLVAYLSDFDDEISVISLKDDFAPNAVALICTGSYNHQLNREIIDGYAVAGPAVICNYVDGEFKSLSTDEVDYFSFQFFFVAENVATMDGAWLLRKAIPKPWPYPSKS